MPCLAVFRFRVLRRLCALPRLRIVAAARSHNQLAMVRRSRLNVHYPVAPKAGGLGGMISNGVLVANILSDLSRDLVHILQRIREVRDAACFLRQHLKGISRSLSFLVIGIIEKSDGIDHRTSQTLHTADSL